MVFGFTDYAFDATVYQHHGAGAAGGHTTVERGAVYGDTEFGSLADSVLFSVDGAHAVVGDVAVFVYEFFHLVADVVAVWQACWGADVACNEDLFIACDDAAASAAVTGGAFGDSVGDFHEVVIP